MSRPSDKAADYFTQGYNCSQATIAGFADELGMEVAQLLRLSAGFGAGMGGTRGTCGAVSAMVIVTSLREGGYAPQDLASKKAFYAKIQGLLAQFKAQHGTLCCKELLEKAALEPLATPSARTPEYYRKRPCLRFVMSAAQMLEAAGRRENVVEGDGGDAQESENAEVAMK